MATSQPRELYDASWVVDRAPRQRMTVKLHHTEIPLTDSAMLDAMTGVLPDGVDLRRLLRPGFDGAVHRYYADIGTAFTIAADGSVAQCFEVSGVTPEEAARIAAGCDEIDEWSVDSFQAIIAEVMGRVGNRMQYLRDRL